MLRAARAEAPDAGIGTFAAAAPSAAAAGDNRYSISLACTVPRAVTLAIDVHGVDGAGVATGHVAHAAKQLELVPRRPLRVGICLRWGEAPTFDIEGVRTAADHHWVGVPLAAPFASVAAEVRAADGRCLDRTVIFQAVAREPAP
jgi:hypothetical protein